ncbi:long-chain acyl-CoA synthetase [Aminobacter aminovorans]|uniref:3-methylmercaptopropionyl-CoA ligase n=1 Tax=Aminobacter aminovorans TaxID=83263 RepID=A0A381IK36_AMIAI|nr:AMP-binding protein [Aminobacter aminovorans]TCS25050.1 long-chain acyl-CoA synthetase [Aminobacter aminovorans]SUY28473.1 Short-chain-fatty-acid--CoA ligase [Aminobacter aminovorans]
MNLANWLHRSALTRPDHTALLHGNRQVETYQGFAARAARLARLLEDRGVAPGDRVAIWMGNHPDYLIGLFAVWWAGGIAVPVNAKLHPHEAAWIVQHSESHIVLSDADHSTLLAAVVSVEVLDIRQAAIAGSSQARPSPQPRGQDDLAWIFYTSGTTGTPKGAMLSHGNLVAMSLAYLADVDDVQHDDCMIYAAPLSHGAGLYSLVHVLRGARHCVPLSGGFDGAEVLELACSLDRASLFAAPTMVHRMTEAVLQGAGDGQGLKTVIYGGGPMYQADLAKAMQVLGPRFTQIYGQGETPMTITVLTTSDHGSFNEPGPQIATVGRPHSVVDVRVTLDGELVPPGTPGEIEVRGPTVMQGYWNDDVAGAGSLRNGWLLTGDIGEMNAAGYLTLTDRSKDVIISGGSNIYPREVEEVLLTHPDIREASVIGLPDPEWGEIVVAIIVAEGEVPNLEKELDRLCCDSIARFKRPKRYVRLPDLPKNNYGKILKTELRRMVS